MHLLVENDKIPDVRSINKWGNVTLPKRVVDHWRKQFPEFRKVEIFDVDGVLVIKPVIEEVA